MSSQSAISRELRMLKLVKVEFTEEDNKFWT
jgi:arginine repressor